LKKSRLDIGPRKSVNDVEIWFAQKAGLFWFLRSNTKIERFEQPKSNSLGERLFQQNRPEAAI